MAHGASKKPNRYKKINEAVKKKKVYKEGETPYDKRREAYKKQLIRDNKNAGYVDMDEDELLKKVHEKYPPSKKVK